MQRAAPGGTYRARLYRAALAWLRARGAGESGHPFRRRLEGADDDYARWRRNHEPGTDPAASPGGAASAHESKRCGIALVTVVGAAGGAAGGPGGDVGDRRPAIGPARELALTLASIAGQSSPPGRHALVVVGPVGADVESLLARAAGAGAAVLRLAGDTSPGAARDAGLAAAGGEFVALLEPGDALQPYALRAIAALIRASGADVVYTDHDVRARNGGRARPFFKPEWSPELLLSRSYLARPLVVRRALLAAIGGYAAPPGVDPDYDLALRATEGATRVAHLPLPAVTLPPRVARSTGAAAPPARFTAAPPLPARTAAPPPPAEAEAERRALEQAIARRGWSARAEHAPGLPFAYRVRFAIRDDPLVSILIPTGRRGRLLERCLASIAARTRDRRYEILILDNAPEGSAGRARAATAGTGGGTPTTRVLRFPETFNFAALNNRGAREARGTLLLFLNDDIEVETDDWLDAMIEHAQRPEVGAVGARLLFPGGGVQHAGVILGLAGVACHAFPNLPRDDPGYGGFSRVVRNYSAVTGACLMMRKDLFERLGGFDEDLRVAYNDLDLCLRAGEAGFRTVYTPYAVLAHHQGATRGTLHPEADETRMRERWRHLLETGDPCYSPNLSLHGWGFSIDPRRGWLGTAGGEVGAARAASGSAVGAGAR
jgi:GT2 family glycosyltransferase